MQSWQSLVELQPNETVTSKTKEMCPLGLPFLTSACGLGSQSQDLKGQQLLMVQGDLRVLGNEENKDVQEPLTSSLVSPAAFRQDHPTIPAG